MNSMNVKLCRFLAGSVFALTALVGMIGNSELSLPIILNIAASLLMAVALFANIHPLFAAGAGVRVLQYLYSLGRMLPGILRGYNIDFMYMLSLLVLVGAYALAALLVFSKRKAVMFSLITALVLIFSGILMDLQYIRYVESFKDLLNQILSGIRFDLCITAMPIILTGIVVQDAAEKHPVAFAPGYGVPGQVPPAYNAPVQAPVYTAPVQAPVYTAPVQAPVYTAPVQPGCADYYEELTRLKELLDRGAISQEEFEEKKRQLLGL